MAHQFGADMLAMQATGQMGAQALRLDEKLIARASHALFIAEKYAGKKQAIELNNAMGHFRSTHDAKGLQACAQLIADSAYLFYAKYKKGQKANEGDKPELVLDAAVLGAGFLIRHVEQRLGMRDYSNPNFKHYPWTADVDEKTFRASVLPYRGQTEKIPDPQLVDFLFDPLKFDELGTGMSYEEFHSRIDEIAGRYAFARDRQTRMGCLKELVVFFNNFVIVECLGQKYAPEGPEDRNSVSSVTHKTGRCTNLCLVLKDLLNAVGLPAVLDRVPAWANGNDNHTWVAVPMPFGTLAVDGGNSCPGGICPAGYFNATGLGRTQPDRKYGVVYRQNGIEKPCKDTELMRKLLDVYGPKWIVENTALVEYYYPLGINGGLIGAEYYQPYDLALSGFSPREIVHLGVFNDNGFTPSRIGEAGITGKAVFEGAQGDGALYIPLRKNSKGTRVAGEPFRFYGDMREYFIPNGKIHGKADYNGFASDALKLAPETEYGLFVFADGGWQLKEIVNTGKNGEAPADLEEGRLCHFAMLAKKGKNGMVYEDRGIADGETHTLWKLDGAGWARIQNKEAKDGRVEFAPEDKDGLYFISFWYSPIPPIRPFSVKPDGKIEIY